MLFSKELKIKSRQARLYELDQQNIMAKDALVLERVRGQMIDLNDSLKRLERFWDKEISEFGGEENKAIAIYNSAREAAMNIGNNYSAIECNPFYMKLVEEFSRLDPQFNSLDIEKLGVLISFGECVIAEDEQQRRREIEELLGNLIDGLLRMLSSRKIPHVIKRVDEIESTMLSQ